MRSVLASAPAKVNLALRVGPPRLDGFHPLDTVFEALDIFDDVEATSVSDSSVTLSISGLGEDLPVDSRNLAVSAALLLQERFAVPTGVALRITKRIPVAGGMAGGSADAAATLVACNKLWNLDLSTDQLMELGAELGSDVPFCILGSLAHGTGRGEVLRPLKVGVMHSWVILTQRQGLSTPEVFREFDSLMDYVRIPETLVPDTQDLQEALEDSDLEAVGRFMVNDLEQPAFVVRPDIREVLRAAQEYGIRAIMSGSGPTVAVLADDFSTADAIAGKLSRQFPELTVLRANGPAAGAHVQVVR